MSSLPQPPSTTTSFLLFDIIATEILPKLPAKSLLRFKSISKSFYNLISSPDFICHHLRHSLFSDNNRLLVIPSSDRTLYTFDLCSVSSTASAASATFSWRQYSNSIVGSCNGLLLIPGFFGISRLVVLNPSTRSYIDVPCAADNLGFGFDHLNNDYKIVAIPDHCVNATYIYSVNSKSWKTVDCTFPVNAPPRPFRGALINDHLLHCLFLVPRTRNYVIGCFDMCLENWRDSVPLPACYYDLSDKFDPYLGVVDGRLFIWFENRVDLSYDVWVMKNYGIQELWMKLLSVAISDKPKWGVVPVACRDAGSIQVLLKHRHWPNLFWYNKVDDVISKVEVPDFWNCQPYICYDSLVVLPEAKHFGAVYEPAVEEWT